MFTFAVTRISKCLTHSAPLEGEVAIIVERSHLVDAPREGTMVDDDVLAFTPPSSIGTITHILELRATAAYVTNYDIVAIAEIESIITKGDAIARSSLSENCCVR